MVPKASPSAPPTKKRIFTLLHHLSVGPAACAESIAPMAMAANANAARR
jgi:hypothetical protein